MNVSDVPAGCAITGKTIIHASLAETVMAAMAIKPRIVEAVEAEDGRALDCPLCGAPSRKYGVAKVRTEGRDAWHTGFVCDGCGFAFRE